ncbi:hypothetical protein B0H14DRAFT_2631496 [Mycena olivaceomarginata]|nr:hypothetical protein B0H14DRAFT_2631496 [Mycena olivaceomarginata]
MSNGQGADARADRKVNCKCKKKCGSPAGEGKWIAFSTRSLHRRQDADSVSTGPAFTAFIASAASTQSPQSTSAGIGNLHGLKRRIPPDTNHGLPKRRLDLDNPGPPQADNSGKQTLSAKTRRPAAQ